MVTKLDMLLQELSSLPNKSHSLINCESFEKALPHFPLLHRVGSQLANPGQIAQLQEFSLNVAPPKAGRAEIGKDKLLFCSIGYPAYANPQLILVLGSVQSTRRHRASTPWDSRGSRLPLKDIQRYTLNAPDDETYLTRHLAACFQDLEAFLSGAAPTQIDPARVFEQQVFNKASASPELHTPEATFSSPMGVKRETLLAVFADTATLGQAWAKTLQALRRTAQEFSSHPGPSGIRGAVSQFVRHRLREQGAPC